MKTLVLAAMAALFATSAFAAAPAAQPAAAPENNLSAETTTPMSKADCEKAMNDCGNDAACKAALVEKGCQKQG